MSFKSLVGEVGQESLAGTRVMLDSVVSAPLDGEEQARWRAEVSSALRAATSQVDLGFHNWACFLAEQASQLSVKGLLAGIGRPSWGHDITSRYPDAVPVSTVMAVDSSRKAG